MPTANQQVLLDRWKQRLVASNPDARISGGFDAAADQPPSDFPADRLQSSTAEATARGAYQGVSLGFGDEISAAKEASGLPAALDLIPTAGPLTRVGIGAVRRLIDPAAAERYNTTVTAERGRNERAAQQHPVANIAGDVVGSLAAPLPIPRVPGAGYAARLLEGAALGGEYGAVRGTGEGTNIENRVSRAIGGGIGGAAVGVAAVPVASAIAGAGRVAQFFNPLKGAVRPAREAENRVASSLVRDNQGSPAAVRQGAQDLTRLQATGTPAVVADIGGEATRGLARSAANTSPEARTALKSVTDTRFAGQSSRAQRFISRITGGADSVDVQEGLQAAARSVNKPAYRAAYRSAPSVWSPGLETLTGSPLVQQAIMQATRTGANRAAAEGVKPVVNPFMRVDGQLRLADPNVTPSLEFWDHVSRNLNDAIGRLQRGNQKSAAGDAIELRKQLLSMLDQASVDPRTGQSLFARARAGAAAFFNADNALEAGQKFVTSRMGNTEARRAMMKMSEPERKLFAAGYASNLINQLGEVRDKLSILDRIFVGGQKGSSAARERTVIALGKQRAAQFEAFLRVEDIMDLLRQAVQGNSTTVQQLAQLGVAGGVGGGYWLEGGSPTMSAALAIGAKFGKLKIDQRIARHVGEMLASHDPQVFMNGLERVAGNQRLMELIRSTHGLLSRGAAPATGRVQLPYGATGSAAQDGERRDDVRQQ